MYIYDSKAQIFAPAVNVSDAYMKQMQYLNTYRLAQKQIVWYGYCYRTEGANLAITRVFHLYFVPLAIHISHALVATKQLANVKTLASI